MPGFYPDGEYDIAGFAVGVVDRDRIIDGSSIRPGDIVIGLPSSGLHSNGFSMVRKIFFGMAKLSTGDYIPELGCTLGEELLKPTRIYAGTVLELIENFEIKGIAHITGGGFFENLPRVLPKGRDIIVRRSSWEVPPVFHLIQKTGDVDEREMFSTFNMGIGLVLITSPYEGDKLVSLLKTKGEKACIIGEVVDGNGEVKVI
jgi:phosphoribosylformylglycinamidine cyclo-ligase